MKKRIIVCCLSLCFISGVFSQVKINPRFEQLLQDANLVFLEPTESSYRAVKALKNDYLDSDFIIRSKREGLEIRYVIQPLSVGEADFWPHVEASRLLTHLASNEEDGVMVGHRIEENQLLQAFGADWAAYYYFEPKSAFGAYRHCRLLALYKEGQAMAYVVFLFNEPSRELEQRLLALQFEQ
ncbi:MAG TPA: hypothetical protein PKA00_20325 [Saprospiraceae bacterium]|nr:hypothetical protein [Saprospiraceae bacterium]HMQ85268.1 hypothetical protein [Saprospiraceae bacterium]